MNKVICDACYKDIEDLMDDLYVNTETGKRYHKNCIRAQSYIIAKQIPSGFRTVAKLQEKVNDDVIKENIIGEIDV